jgi:hypothetical protein
MAILNYLGNVGQRHLEQRISCIAARTAAPPSSGGRASGKILTIRVRRTGGGHGYGGAFARRRQANRDDTQQEHPENDKPDSCAYAQCAISLLGLYDAAFHGCRSVPP